MSELAVLNQLCRELYETTDQSARLRAEQNLSELAASPECLQRCMLLLEQGDLPYAPLVASNTLMKLLNSKTTAVLPPQRLELCRYILSHLGARAASLPPYIVTSLCQLFARITKLEWTYQDAGSKEFPFRAPIESIIGTISMDNIDESLLAIQVLSLLVVDMNSPVGMESISKHRKSSSCFRDLFLFKMFQLSIELLEKYVGVSTCSQQQMRMVVALLELTLNALLFDFIGSMSDETSDDNYTVQVPTMWRPSFLDGSIVKLMYELYMKLPGEATEKVMHILVQLASLRRTIFNSTERQVYLEQLMGGVKLVIENSEKLSDQGTFHEFCRLIARLKTNFQLCELIKVPDYSAIMRLLAEFTVTSLRMMEFSANSSYFLLTFWQRMVTSVPYVRSQDDHLLNVYCPEIMQAYAESRLANVERVIRDGAEDPLDDQGAIIQVMEQLSVICRCEYQVTCNLLARLFDENAQVMEAGNGESARIAEGRLVWLVTLIGTAIFGKTTTTNNDEHDRMDGDLVARCLKFMRLNDSRLSFPQSVSQHPGNGNLRLEVAFVHLLEQFRRAYIMDQVSRASPVYEKLQLHVGISDETDMLGVIVQKIITNLKYWPTSDAILQLTLSLLKDLSLGYTAVRKLFRLGDVQLLLNNHTANDFAFLGPSVDWATMKHRTTFYEALTRLLATDLNDDEEVFAQFMQPLTDTVSNICGVMSGKSNADQEQLKRAVVGVCRDVRGIAIACITKSHFQMLFEWLYPAVFEMLLRAVEEWSDDAHVTTPVFRLLAELCQNRQQRLKFEMSSCSAVLLFRQVSKIMCSYGERLLQLPAVPKERAYRERFKNIGVCFAVLKSALVGAYVPFGVFRLYGDGCLQNALNMFIKMYLCIPEADFQSYTKIAQNYYHLMESLVGDNMSFISHLEPDIFASILRSIQQGVLSIDAVVITASCASLDTILNYLFKRLTRTQPIQHKVGMEPEGENCIVAVKQQPQLLAELLQSMLSALVVGEVKCQWSMSRPLLGLILMQEDVFTQLKNELIQQLAPAKHEQLDGLFVQLMEGVERNMTVKNKDVFTQNLARFRREIVDVLKGKEETSNGTNNNMMC